MSERIIPQLDGWCGIVDNQGIDSILFFHRKVNLDLVMVIDSASLGMDKNRESRDTKVPIVGNLQMSTILFWISI